MVMPLPTFTDLLLWKFTHDLAVFSTMAPGAPGAILSSVGLRLQGRHGIGRAVLQHRQRDLPRSRRQLSSAQQLKRPNSSAQQLCSAFGESRSRGRLVANLLKPKGEELPYRKKHIEAKQSGESLILSSCFSARCGASAGF